MEYIFPVITHLDEVKKAIEGRREFNIVNKGEYIVVNYVVYTKETFPKITEETPEATILRECRGMIFYPTGEIMSRPYHKFFNVGERDETAAEDLDMTSPHIVLEKLDGSMIRPVYLFKNPSDPVPIIRWGTKMGLTEVADIAEAFVATRPQYAALAMYCYETGLTPIFELCSRENRIVVDYPSTELVLTGVRHTVSGLYFAYEELVALGVRFSVEVVRARGAASTDMAAFLSQVREEEQGEGYVVRFASGHMVKAKTQWYLGLHRAKDLISAEKGVLGLILQEKVDDLKGMLSREDRERLENYETAVLSGLQRTQDELCELYGKCQGLDRKTIALNIAQTLDTKKRSLLFTLLKHADDKKELITREHCWNLLVEFVLGNLVSQKKVDEMRDLWGGVRWAFDWGQGIVIGDDAAVLDGEDE